MGTCRRLRTPALPVIVVPLVVVVVVSRGVMVWRGLERTCLRRVDEGADDAEGAGVEEEVDLVGLVAAHAEKISRYGCVYKFGWVGSAWGGSHDAVLHAPMPARHPHTRTTHRARGVTPGTVAMAASMEMAIPSSIIPCCACHVCVMCVCMREWLVNRLVERLRHTQAVYAHVTDLEIDRPHRSHYTNTSHHPAPPPPKKNTHHHTTQKHTHHHTRPLTHLAVHEAGVKALAGHGLGSKSVPHAQPRRDGGALGFPQIQHAVLEAVGSHGWMDGRSLGYSATVVLMLRRRWACCWLAPVDGWCMWGGEERRE